MRDEPSRTAEYVCLARADEARRPAAERILDDPYAEWFLGARVRALGAGMQLGGALRQRIERITPDVMAFVVCRHRFIDDALHAALDAGVEQVAILGAGYDSRGLRFAEALAGRPVFELDFPSTSKRKRRLLARNRARLPKVDLRQLEIDFLRESIDEKLVGAGFVAGRPSFFIWEGVSMYLTRAAVKATLATLRRLGGAGSELAMDLWSLPDAPTLAGTAQRTLPNLLALFGEPLGMSLHPEDAGAFFAREGFRLLDLADSGELERRYVRDGRRIFPNLYVVRAGPAESQERGLTPFFDSQPTIS